MSTSYHIQCKTCSVTVTGGWHSPETPVAVIAHYAFMATLSKLMAKPPDGIDLGFGRGSFMIGYADEGFDYVSFAQHAEHELVVMDEYGYEIDACWERFICDGCGSQHSCADKKGHEGRHLTREQLREKS